MTDTEKLREQFEAWARKNELEAERHKYADDQYDDHAATSAWWAWRDAFQVGHAAAKAETPNVGEPVAWRLTNTAFRSPKFEYHSTQELAKQRQEDFNRSVDDGGLHDLTPLYTADQLAAAVAAEREKCAGIVNELRMECARRNMPESATMLWHAEDAIRAGDAKEDRS